MHAFRRDKNAFLSPLDPLSRPSSHFCYPHESAKSLLTNTPIPDTEAVARRVRRELESRHPLTRVRLVNLVLNSYVSLTKMTRDEALWAVNDRIFDEMLRLCSTHDAAFLLLYLPHGPELTDPAFESYGEAYFEDFVARTGVESLNPRPLFLASEARYRSGHYRRPAATLVAQAVYEKITELARPGLGPMPGSLGRSFAPSTT